MRIPRPRAYPPSIQPKPVPALPPRHAAFYSRFRGHLSRLLRVGAFWGYSWDMSKALVTIAVGELQVWVEHNADVYPDQLTDLCNRAAILFGTAMAQAKANGVNIMSPDGLFDDDDEDEEEVE